ncbi:MAG: hypothetical protein JNM27_13480 [Leptospirales bacterium]|nr:hypothetical protein [Leptospirales bacterium]
MDPNIKTISVYSELDQLSDAILKEYYAGYKVNLEPPQNLTRSQILQILESLPEGGAIEFFEYRDGSWINDWSGLFTTTQRLDEAFAFKGGNHGRSSSWRKISTSDLADFILANLRQPDAFLQVGRADRPVRNWHSSYLDEL